MKKTILYTIVFAFILSGCLGTSNPADFNPSIPQEGVTGVTLEATPMPSATPSPVPTATIDYQATNAVSMTRAADARQESYRAQQEAINAQNTSIAANVAIAQITAQYETQKFEIAKITQGAADIAETHIAETQTQQPTADANKNTQQALVLAVITLQSGQLTGTANAPALLQQMNAAEFQRDYSWLIPVLTVAACVFLLGLLVYVFRRAEREIPKQVMPKEKEFKPIPMAAVGDNPLQTERAEINCTIEELFDFADGIINDHMTPAFNAWDGRISRKILKEIRDELAHHHKLKVIPKSNGELVVLADGELFLRYVLEHGCPPPPFVCIAQNTTPTDHTHEIMPMKAVGERFE